MAARPQTAWFDHKPRDPRPARSMTLPRLFHRIAMNLRPRQGSSRPPVSTPVLICLATALAALACVPQAEALVRFDFEQKYYRHPGRQVWDFSIIRPDSIYHIFYHSIPLAAPSAANGDTIWQATSTDLRHWNAPTPILASGAGPWEAGAIWAPDVFRDEAGNRWVIAYTGCDASYNQSICLAFSDDLVKWEKSLDNPVIEPDTTLYVWSRTGSWSDFRDPYIYREGDQWHALVTARQNLGGNKGVLYHGVSDDLLNWTDLGPLFVNDGLEPWRVLESPQFHTIGTTDLLLFGEFDTVGTTILAAASPDAWTMDNRVLLDYGYAPELDEFDPGIPIYSRLGTFLMPDNATIGYVVRFDTLRTNPDGTGPSVYRPHPMDADWLVHSGTANLGSPTFGDNPVWRGEPSVGLVGNFYFGSKEYYQGPLSGRGSPGTQLGVGVTGIAESHRFPVTGDRMTLLVGGGNFPGTCYVALVDDTDDAILLSETGTGADPMTSREWDLTPFQGRVCYIRIADLETGPGGHINVDEIVEIADPSPVGEAVPTDRPLRHGAWPNPFNPRTRISFDLAGPTACEVRVHDLRGQLVWRSGSFAGQAGANAAVWNGLDVQGQAVAAGTYLYAIDIAGTVRASGKIALVK